MAAADCVLRHPVIIHGPRRIRPDSLEEYKKAFVAVADAVYEGNPGVKAFFAFADHHDPLLYWHVLWSSSRRPDASSSLLDTLAGHYLSTPEDPDTMDVYGGGWDDLAAVDAIQQRQQSALWRGVRFRSHRLLSGFIKDDGAGQEGPPMIGFTKRHVQAGRLNALAASFQPVLDQWQSKIPGILCAAVSRCDDDPPNVVHDIRIFANKAAYAAHTQKDDEALTAAMATWFDNYDRSHPFTGELYVENAPKIDTSSTIEGKPIRPDFSLFGFDQGNFLGRVPDMTRGDGDGE